MDVANELLDAIEIIVDKKVRENTTQIYPGICKSVSGSSCVMSINGKDNTIQFYGSIPTVGAIYRVFVPDGNMSMAFAITGNDDRKGLHYSNPNLLDNWYFGNPVNQRGQTEYTTPGYTVDRWLQGFDGTMTSTLTNDGIKITAGNDGTYKNFEQVFPDIPTNSTFTLSFLVDNYAFVNQIYCGLGIGQFDIKDNLISVTFKTGSSISGRKSFGIQVKIGKTATVLAAKLELGSTQTLAHLENGCWVLNEIPKYEDVLSNCQRYTFNVVNSDDNFEILGSGFAMSASQFFCFIPTPTTLRGKPSIAYSGSFRAVRDTAAMDGVAINTMVVDHVSNNGVLVICTGTTSFKASEFYTLWCVPGEGTNSLIFSADLY